MVSIFNTEPIMPTNLDSLEHELESRTNKLDALAKAIDAAAEAGDADEIARLHSESVVEAAMRESTQRRIEKAKHVLSEEEKAAKRQENLDAADFITKSAEADIKLAANVSKAIDNLVAQVKAMHVHGELARDPIHHLIRQRPERDREQLWSLAQGVAHGDTLLATLIEDALQRAGMFLDLAPHPSLRLARHSLPPMVEHYEGRAIKLANAVQRLAKRDNEALQ